VFRSPKFIHFIRALCFQYKSFCSFALSSRYLKAPSLATRSHLRAPLRHNSSSLLNSLILFSNPPSTLGPQSAKSCALAAGHQSPIVPRHPSPLLYTAPPPMLPQSESLHHLCLPARVPPPCQSEGVGDQSACGIPIHHPEIWEHFLPFRWGAKYVACGERGGEPWW